MIQDAKFRRKAIVYSSYVSNSCVRTVMFDSQGRVGPRVTRNNAFSCFRRSEISFFDEISAAENRTFLSGPKWLSIVLYLSAEVRPMKISQAALAARMLDTAKLEGREAYLQGNQTLHNHVQPFEGHPQFLRRP